jgi:hypothetical protein
MAAGGRPGNFNLKPVQSTTVEGKLKVKTITNSIKDQN